MEKKKVIIIMDIEKGTAKMLQTKKSIEIFSGLKTIKMNTKDKARNHEIKEIL